MEIQINFSISSATHHITCTTDSDSMNTVVLVVPVINKRCFDRISNVVMSVPYSSGDNARNRRSYPSGACCTGCRTELGERQALCITGDQQETG